MTIRVDKAADAILALINSKPRSPTRAELVAVLNGIVLHDTTSPWKPTELGHEMIELLPAHAVSTWHDGYLEADDPDANDIEALHDATWEPIKQRALQATNIVDLAIAYRIAADGDTPQDMIDRCKHRREEVPERHEVMQMMEPSAFLAYELASTVLRLADFPEHKCSLAALWHRNGWNGRKPTKTERREALARPRQA
jgi:hypothetical protein